MKKLFTLLLTFSVGSSFGQITFEKTYPTFSTAYSIEEQSDGSFYGAADSLNNGYVYHIDNRGNLISTHMPLLRGHSSANIYDLHVEQTSGNFVMCGYNDDLLNPDSTAFFVRMDSAFHNTDSLFYAGSVTGGPSAHNLVATPEGNYVVSIKTFTGAGTGQSLGQKIYSPAGNGWVAHPGTDENFNSMAMDQSGNLIMLAANITAAAYSGIRVYDTAGVQIGSFDITDTAMGGSLIFGGAVSAGPGNTFMFAGNVEPFSGNSVTYIAQFDQTFNLLWGKYLNWGINMSTVAMTPTADGDIMVLLSTANGYAFHKMMANGDSLWTQFHNRPTTGSIYRFRECSDRGFIACGTFNGFAGNQGYILKTDSLARLLPDNLVTVSGSLEFCNGDSVVLTAQPGYSYQWNQGSASQSIIVNTEGCYYVAVFDSLGNYAYSDSFCVIIHTPVTPLVTYLNDTLYSTLATTYQWYQGSVMIAGATNQFYVPSMNDFYHVVITDSTGCSASSADYQVTNVGVDGISGSLKPVLFPNPGKENSVIRIANLPAGSYELVVFDAIGKMILSKTIESSSNEIVVPTDKLRSGSYQIKLSNGKNVVNMHFDIL